MEGGTHGNHRGKTASLAPRISITVSADLDVISSLCYDEALARPADDIKKLMARSDEDR